MSLQNDLPELVKAGVISEDTAADIASYYQGKQTSPTNKLFVVFGILGAILVGLGIILIIAHNWDDLSRGLKTVFAFLPLVIGQALCAFSFLKKPGNLAWKESSSVFLFFTVGASIALVSQIYHIPGDLSTYLLTWMLLTLPLIYVMQSPMTSLLCLVGITYYACETSYWGFPTSNSYLYWAMLAAMVPFYYQLFRKNPSSNFVRFHNWLVPLSLVTVLGTLSATLDEFMFIAYISLFGFFYLLGTGAWMPQENTKNGYTILGSLGTIILLLFLSFNEFWEHLFKKELQLTEIFASQEFVLIVLLTLAASVLLYRTIQQKGIRNLSLFSVVFLVFIPIFFIGTASTIAVVLVNVLIFLLGVFTIREGSRKNHLGLLNYGLLIITALIICRFFDTDLSFVARGLLFVGVGAGFFFANYWMIQKRKEK
ncbi:DUF2157 domain-containing protein [Flagellimonas sp.]|uniref:DUF2157 domain-containing protein n=1 Tax=Flagellimonas sp. TaxID=2058762 RepID=UPI003BABA1E6